MLKERMKMVDFNRLLETRKHAKELRDTQMATRSNVTTETPDDDDIPEIPPAFDGSNGSSDTLNEGLTLEELNERGFNDAQDEEELKKLNPPTGDWIKDDRWVVAKRTNTEDSSEGDLDTQGRTIFTFQGKPQARTANGLEYQPTFFLRVSPDRRFKADKPQEVDMAYKLFLKTKELYISSKGEKPKNIGQLVKMLIEDSYIVRSMNGDSGAIAVDIKPLRIKK